MKLEDLDRRQREVIETVLAHDTSLLVLGGPGTGKTTVALWAARAFLGKTDPGLKSRVLFLTFSRATVSNIVARSPGITAGCHDRIEILTFHGLAYRLIRAFGLYSGYGMVTPTIQSEVRARLLGHDKHQLRYNGLIPGAISILNRSCRIRELVSSRWGLIICDEVQDTNVEQWTLLRLIAGRKLILLGDGSQMIYTFIPGVSAHQFQAIRESVEREIELQIRSHRDPSGVIPALAEAVRKRQFDHAAVDEALQSKRLVIHTNIEASRHKELIVDEINLAKDLGARDVGIFAHSNQSVADLAQVLDDAGIDHVLVGIPEAHAEALTAMAVQCKFAIGLETSIQVRQSFALFLTATVRSSQTPPMARSLVGEQDLPQLVEQALIKLEEALKHASTGKLNELMRIAVRSWRDLAIEAGYRPWARAADHFLRVAHPLRHRPVSPETIKQLAGMIERSRIEALIDLDYSARGRVKLMNYHQTKGREADVVIHVFQSGDFFGTEVEPFDKGSRLLNVAISRAKKRVVVILPPDPHPLVEPFSKLIRMS